ncbi:hypothetical protein GM415_01450 [Pseudodesulfovibrio cashew]|uniref:Chemotaxis protein n=1 Tax=Pseudodesulfovibrio cashew TaxID=2678688 RepID=A0A6I6JCP5_9BACT|nr:hypothetical protein [Pseudodesulfovibrio cashew]QGY38858.1 hypothetical protein GM415_01450 [Pseudodesulfovibrio cashew]
MFKHFALLLSLMTILAGCAGGVASTMNQAAFRHVPAQPGKTRASKGSNAKARLQGIGPLELQAAIMSFADTSNARIAEAAAALEEIGTPQARVTAARMMVFDVSSNVEIAAGPYPGMALLDLIVVTTLRRMVWEDFWLPRFGPEAEKAMEQFREMEEDVWEEASRVMNAEQMAEMRMIIEAWRAKHPKQVAVNYVRFSDFGELGLKPALRRLDQPGGLFASVQAAALVAEDMKVAVDRAFYLMSRMQLVISYQVELAYLELLFQPEVNGLINETENMTSLGERYAEIAEKLPEELRTESSKIVNQLFTQLAQNSDRTINTALTGLTQWQNQAIVGIMENISKEREAAINQAIAGLVLQQNELYQRVDRLVDRSSSELERSMDHAFLLGLLLLGAFFLLLTLYKVFVARPLDRRRS